MFPLKDYKYDIPVGNALGAFGVVRKHDIHTGVDLYCEPDAEVFAISDGIVVAIEVFTGVGAGSPWWNDTKAVIVRNSEGLHWLYGEMNPSVLVGQQVYRGDKLGTVIPVLKKDKGKTPTCMLHVELYYKYIHSVVWEHNKEIPEGLIDPTSILLYLKECLHSSVVEQSPSKR